MTAGSGCSPGSAVPAAGPWARRDDLPGWNRSVFPAGPAGSYQRPGLSLRSRGSGTAGAVCEAAIIRRSGSSLRVGSHVTTSSWAAVRYHVARIGGPPGIRAGGWWPVSLRRLVGGGVIADRRRHEGWVGLGRWPKIPCGEDVRHRASHDRYESGLRDGSADFERSWTLASIPASAAHLAASCRSALCAGLPAAASAPSLRHEQAAPCLSTPRRRVLPHARTKSIDFRQSRWRGEVGLLRRRGGILTTYGGSGRRCSRRPARRAGRRAGRPGDLPGVRA